MILGRPLFVNDESSFHADLARPYRSKRSPLLNGKPWKEKSSLGGNRFNAVVDCGDGFKKTSVDILYSKRVELLSSAM